MRALRRLACLTGLVVLAIAVPVGLWAATGQPAWWLLVPAWLLVLLAVLVELGNELNIFYAIHGPAAQGSVAQYVQDLATARRLEGSLLSPGLCLIFPPFRGYNAGAMPRPARRFKRRRGAVSSGGVSLCL